MALPTPKQHNDEFFRTYVSPTEWSEVGLSCPDCGTQLHVNNQMALLSNPPQRLVRCPNCVYRGTIY